MGTVVGRGGRVGGALVPALRSVESGAHRMAVMSAVILPVRPETLPASFEAVGVREMAPASKQPARGPSPRPSLAMPAAAASASYRHPVRGRWAADLQGIA
jgi:hypothetical protein